MSFYPSRAVLLDDADFMVSMEHYDRICKRYYPSQLAPCMFLDFKFIKGGVIYTLRCCGGDPALCSEKDNIKKLFGEINKEY